jgi:hypothetical protein
MGELPRVVRVVLTVMVVAALVSLSVRVWVH